jgi:hypothetical protein
VCVVSTFTVRGVVFIGVNGTSTAWRGRFGAGWWPASRVLWPPPTRASPRVDAWQPRHGANNLKPWPASQGVGPASQPLGPLHLGSGPLGPRVKYTPVVMMIFTFGPLQFAIP